MRAKESVEPGKVGSKEWKKSKERGISKPEHLIQTKQATGKTEGIKSRGGAAKRVASGGQAPSLGESLKEELGINPPAACASRRYQHATEASTPSSIRRCS